jgi:flavin-dependent dehydrogenase
MDAGPAGQAACGYILHHVPALRDVLRGAQLEAAWQGAGPIRPGFRTLAEDGLFRAGNAAGEAHPLVAEGICMAIESAALLSGALRTWDGTYASLRSIERAYRRAWRRTIASRIVAAAAIERLTAAAPRLTAQLARGAPALFDLAARWSGKGRAAWA